MQYRMARREGEDLHPIFGLRKLGQLFVIDVWSRIIEQRLYHVRDHYKQVYKAKRFFWLIEILQSHAGATFLKRWKSKPGGEIVNSAS